MQVITMRTPVSKCREVAEHAVHMLGKFPENPRLTEMSLRLGEGMQSFESADLALQAAERAAMLTRIDAHYENYMSDTCMRHVKKQVEAQDAHRGGRVASLIYTSGTPDFARLQGWPQVEEMRRFEIRLVAAQDVWPGAAVEAAKVITHRVRYENALTARDESSRRIEEARTARNTAKERFVHLYSEIVSLVRAEFPRDRRTQELFFLSAGPRRGKRDEVGDDPNDGDDGDDLPEVPEVPDEVTAG